MTMEGRVTVVGQRDALTSKQLKQIGQLAQQLHREDDLDKEEALDEAYRRLGFGQKNG